MADEKTQKLLQGGIKAARKGDKALARRAFRQVIKLEPENEAAWLGMATVAENTKEKLQALKQLLQINPNHPQAQEAVKRLGLTPERLLGTAPAAEIVEDTTDDDADAAPAADVTFDDDADVAESDEDAKAALFDSDDGDDSDDISTSQSVFLSDDDADDGAFTADDLGMDDDTSADALWDDDADAPPLEDTIEDITDAADDADATEGNTLFLRDELGVGEEIDEADDDFFAEVDADEYEEAPAPEVVDDTDEEEPPPPRKTSAEAFAELPPPPRGNAGTPIPDEDLLPQVARAAEEKTQAYLERVLAEYQMADWKEKRRGLAGAREHIFFLLQAGSATLLVLLIIGGGLTAAILNSPEAQRILFAPTWTPSPTPTLTPTATPGVTNTPSPTPDPTLTPSPTLEPSVTPYPTDPNFPPEPTDIYRPQIIGQDLSQQSENAALLLLDDEPGNLDEAFELLREDIQASGTAQTYWSYYYLTLLYLQQDQLAEAQENVEAGVEAIPETDLEEYQALINVSRARVDIYEARQLLDADNEQEATPLLEEAEALLLDVVAEDGIDRRFIEAYLLLAEVNQLQEEPEEALEILTGAINSGVTGDIYTDTRLRMARARIYRQQEDYARALQEVNDVLLINPFLENALTFQVEVALAADQPGLAVLYSQQYLLYYPNSVRGYQLLGEARLAENKPDLALNAFSQGLQGDPDDPAYIDVLLTRGNIYRDQQRFDAARDDFNQALSLSEGDNIVIRLNRMRAAYIEGDYATALEDAETLLNSDNPDVPTGEVLLLQGRIEVDEDDDYSEAISLINRAINIVGIEPDLRPVANEYLARAYLAQDEYDAALNNISAALEGAETGSRYYLLGQILEERGREREIEADLEQAVDAYEFVLTWSNIYPYPFLDDVQERYDDLIDELDTDDTA